MKGMSLLDLAPSKGAESSEDSALSSDEDMAPEGDPLVEISQRMMDAKSPADYSLALRDAIEKVLAEREADKALV